MRGDGDASVFNHEYKGLLKHWSHSRYLPKSKRQNPGFVSQKLKSDLSQQAETENIPKTTTCEGRSVLRVSERVEKLPEATWTAIVDEMTPLL